MDVPIKSKPLSKLSLWVKIHKKEILISAGIFLLIVGGTVAFLIFSYKAPIEDKTPVASVIEEPKPEPIKYFSPLTGVAYDSEDKITQPVTAIMIENSPEARPQSGLKESGIVFEAIAEAGITRFLAIYQSEKPKLVGPVRSIRLYYAQWIAGFNASIIHVGGSETGLAEIRSGGYRDLDQFAYAEAYWRATDRYAPHNVYTGFEKIDALNLKKGYTSSTYDAFLRIDGEPSEAPDATQINFNISSPMYNSSYVYDKETNTYLRSQAGTPHLDREKGQISPSVVIAMHVEQSTLSSGHESIKVISSGNATIFQNGIATNVTWSKDSKTDQIKFTDILGEEIPLVRGQTWITAIPNGRGDVKWN